MTRHSGAKSPESSRPAAHTERHADQAHASAAPPPVPTTGRSRPLLLGHRGARPLSRFKPNARGQGIPPENTIACFEYALAHGCDGFEFDVRVTRDARLVLCHNAWLGGYKISASLFDSLCSRRGETLPCLEDVQSAFGGRAYLDIEVKVAGGEELIVNALRCSLPQRFLLSSFLPEVLLRFHQLDPSLPLGYICDRSADVRPWPELPIQVFLPQYKLVNEELIREVHSRGLQIFAWTVNRKEDLRRLTAWGIDGLISDDPDSLCRIVRPLASTG
jgi:glycerophosphoryl diester phosphodiesterase